MFKNSTVVNEYKWLNNYAVLYRSESGYFLDSNNLRCVLTLLTSLPPDGTLYINEIFARYVEFFYICEESIPFDGDIILLGSNPCGGNIIGIKYKSRRQNFISDIIDSKKHPVILEYKQRGDISRGGNNLFVIEGERLIKRAVDDKLMLENIIYSSKSTLAKDGYINSANCPCYLSNEGIMSAISTSKPVPSEIALCVMPQYPLESVLYGERTSLIITDNIENPDNLGLVLRTSDACGADAVIVTGNGAAPHHKNCVRASRGALGRLPIIYRPDGESLISILKSANVAVIGTSARAEYSIYDFTPPKKFAAVIGSESFGITADIAALCNIMVTIPMARGQSSLNVAVAAGVILSASSVHSGLI